MYIIIIGGGRLGYHLTKALLDEGQEVLVIEKDAASSQIIINELGSVCLHGDGCEAATLEAAGTPDVANYTYSPPPIQTES